jgi:hypothetical protein
MPEFTVAQIKQATAVSATTIWRRSLELEIQGKISKRVRIGGYGGGQTVIQFPGELHQLVALLEFKKEKKVPTCVQCGRGLPLFLRPAGYPPWLRTRTSGCLG